MDMPTLELLFKENRSTVMEFVKMLFNDMKNEVADIRKENEELKKSLEFSQHKLDEASAAVVRQESELKELRSQLGSDVNIAERVRKLEDYSRRNNIIIDGIPERKDENEEVLLRDVNNLVSNKLDIEMDIDVCHRLGNKNISSNRPRPTIVRLASHSQRDKCLKSSHKLKGTNIFINEDVSKTTHEIRKSKLDLLKEKRRQGFKAYFSDVDVVIKSRNNINPGTPTVVNSEKIVGNTKEIQKESYKEKLRAPNQKQRKVTKDK